MNNVDWVMLLHSVCFDGSVSRYGVKALLQSPLQIIVILLSRFSFSFTQYHALLFIDESQPHTCVKLLT